MQVTTAVVEMVRAELGLGVVPRWALSDGGGAPRGIRVVRITRKGLYRTWHTAVRKEEIGRPATETFVRLLAEDVDGNKVRAKRAGLLSR
jgi:DNA-binding transcriptional LysR family regulator